MEVPSDPNQKANIVPPLTGRSVFDHRPNPLAPNAQPETPPAPEERAAKSPGPRINLAAAAVLGLAAVALVAIFIVAYSKAKAPPLESAKLAWPAHLQPEQANRPYPQPDQLQIFASQPIEADAFMNRGTYRIICRDASRKEVHRGAGFAIGGRLLVTCLSVVKDAESLTVVPQGLSNPPEIPVTTALVWDAAHDLMILELPVEHPAPAPFTLECLSLPFEGDKVYHLAHLAASTATLSEGVIRGHAEGPAHLQHIVFDSPFPHRWPGGALVNGRGAVVGILEESSDEVQAGRRAIPVAALWELLSHSPRPRAVRSLSNN